ncbi:homoserine kinase [Planotetraspora phitsanulokensis]|uniref:Homoserine kinase n=1 Tax=Planotetraspora phitsanulokensis TaxID=575192 RepID=A0A8J3U536_9ACTN|nr:homoserine kinase [Planotetraspora phitsanulokensis]GII38649.1 homoserine kinase [Planotetraspora phitsanulokensis]
MTTDNDRPGVVVRVPATSANLGPGFDSLGLALDLHDEVEATLLADGGVRVHVEGEGVGELDLGEGHLIVKAMRATFDRMGAAQPAGIRLRCLNRIPHARGLGSSSAAICAGILAARALAGTAGPRGAEATGPGDLTDADVFALATELEGHPDNVAPCLAGGLTIAWSDQSGPARMVKLTPHEDVRPVVLIPGFRLSTEEARGLLPKDVPHSDAAANAGRAALLIAALTQTPEPGLLMAATEDRLHQDYRAPAMPRTADLVHRLRSAGVPAVVSGAGPTVLVFSTRDTQDLIAPEVGTEWLIQPMNVDTVGAGVLFPETR